MWHRWIVILGQLVYVGKIDQPQNKPPTAYDFITEDRASPHAVRVRMNDQIIPVFHPRDARHSAQLKRTYVPPSNSAYC